MSTDWLETSYIRMKKAGPPQEPIITLSEDEDVTAEKNVEKSLTSAVKEMRDKALFPEDCSQETLIGVCMSVYFPKLCVTVLLVPDWYFLEDNSLTLISCVFFLMKATEIPEMIVLKFWLSG